MYLSEALAKLQEILEVIIGKSAEEWRLQKQSTSFTSEWEWAQHLLSVHKTCCKGLDCGLHHSGTSDSFSASKSTETKSDLTFSHAPRPVSQIIANQSILKSKRRNRVGFQKRHASRWRGENFARKIMPPFQQDCENASADLSSPPPGGSDVKRESDAVELVATGDQSVEGVRPASNLDSTLVKQERDDVVLVESGDEESIEPSYDDTRNSSGFVTPSFTRTWSDAAAAATTSGTSFVREGRDDTTYTVTTVTGDESWQFAPASENDLVQADYNEGDSSYYETPDDQIYTDVKQEPNDELMEPATSHESQTFESIEFVESRKRVPCAVLAGHRYVMRSKPRNRTYWKCHLFGASRGSCRATLVTEGDKVISHPGQHNHEPDRDQRAIEAAKIEMRKRARHEFTPVPRIYHEEHDKFRRSGVSPYAAFPTFRSVSTVMYKERQKLKCSEQDVYLAAAASQIVRNDLDESARRFMSDLNVDSLSQSLQDHSKVASD